MLVNLCTDRVLYLFDFNLIVGFLSFRKYGVWRVNEREEIGDVNGPCTIVGREQHGLREVVA